MITTIDGAGRVVIRAEVRSRAGLKPGTDLDVILEDGIVHLVPRVPGRRLVRVGKRLVARPRTRPRQRVDVARLVEEERNR